MAPTNDPLKTISKTLTAMVKSLTSLFRSAMKTLKALLKPLINLLKAIVSATKEIGSVIGKALLDGLITSANSVVSALRSLEIDLGGLFAMFRRALEMIRKATEPATIASALRSLLQKLRKKILAIGTLVRELLAQLDVIAPALKAFDTFRAVLQALFSWVATIPGVLAGVKTAQAMLRALLRKIVSQAREVADLVKQAAQLRAA